MAVKFKKKGTRIDDKVISAFGRDDSKKASLSNSDSLYKVGLAQRNPTSSCYFGGCAEYISMTFKEFIKELKSPETWRRVQFLDQFKSRDEWDRKFTKEDIVPLIIIFFIMAVGCSIIFVIMTVIKSAIGPYVVR